MFHVIGTINSVPYRVGVHDEDMGRGTGGVMGSRHATSLLELHRGDPVQATPTSSPIALDLLNPVSVLAALRQHTTVTVVDGDVPETGDEPVAGSYY